MALQTTGRISLGDIQQELKDTGSIGLGEEIVRKLTQDDGGAISMSQAYGRQNIMGDYVWKTTPDPSLDTTIPIAMPAGTRIMTVFRCGSAGNCSGNNYGNMSLPDQGITIFDGTIAGYWGGMGPDTWGQWRVYTLGTSVPANARLTMSRTADGCGLIGSTQIYIAAGYPSVFSADEVSRANADGWSFGLSADYNGDAPFEDTTPVNYGSPQPRLSSDTVSGAAEYGSVYWDFGGAAQTTRDATSPLTIKAGASCIIRGGFIKPGGNYAVNANIRLSTDAGTFYESTISSWYGAHGEAVQPLAGYEFTAPFDIPKGTNIQAYHYTNGQYGDGTACSYVYLDVANLV